MSNISPAAFFHILKSAQGDTRLRILFRLVAALNLSIIHKMLVLLRQSNDEDNYQAERIKVVESLNSIRLYLLDELTSQSFSPIKLSYRDSYVAALKQKPRISSKEEISWLIEQLDLKQQVTERDIKASQIRSAKRLRNELCSYRARILKYLNKLDGHIVTLNTANDAYCKLPVLVQEQMMQMLQRAIIRGMYL